MDTVCCQGSTQDVVKALIRSVRASSVTSSTPFPIRSIASDTLGSLGEENIVNMYRLVEALAEADAVLARMDSLCGDGIESTPHRENARLKLVIDAAIERLRLSD
jgi:hypothetical protein